MPGLLEAQRAFAAALDAPGDAGMRAYRANVLGNRAAALAGAYPIVRKIVGEAFFDALAAEYGRVHPSKGGDLSEYGEHLARFVAAFPHTLDLPYLPDVARMEWLAHRAYYAADPPVPDLSRIDAVRLAPACALLESVWPLMRIWEVHQDDFSGEVAVDLDAGPERLLVHRPRWRAKVCALQEGDWQFLRSAARGSSLEHCLAAAAIDPGFNAATSPARWVQLGVLVL
jgi:hypothetical protein